ncbi:MAG: NAD(P)-binding domain-containing protein [Chitinophagaceae bacterium]|nr:NAD(P)-binding domain-containing protein [Chitinophagaceae bacterium]
MRFGIIGNGSWATAIVKILTGNNHTINWWVRNTESIDHIKKHRHNPHYLRTVELNINLLQMSSDVKEVVSQSDIVIVAVPSAFAKDALTGLAADDWKNKKVVSAIKGLLPDKNRLLNDYLEEKFGVPLENYFAVLGPCHAEEVAAEKLSYLTFSGIDTAAANEIASHFHGSFINTIVNHDILGVQYAAVLKNIYALGAGIAHGLDYGDNFLSVFIANAADEMASFLRQFGAEHITVGEHEGEDPVTHLKTPNYAASVYLGDLLVTCYSLHSRNRTFGNMIGKGYSVQTAQLEMNMIAEGYNASKCIYLINQQVKAPMPIAETVYRILWENVKPEEGYREMEPGLI